MGLRMIFGKLPFKMQWLMGLVLPIVRELNTWILNKLLNMSVETDKIVAKLITTISINVVHSFFVAIIISSMANQITSFCILGVDFTLNLYMCYKIIRMQRKIDVDVAENESMAQLKKGETFNLFAVEAVEAFIPLILGMTIPLAYYGPNAGILGGIRNDYWHFKKINDIAVVIAELGLMFSIDVFSFILICFLLYQFCNIDFFYEGFQFMKIYWPIMAIKIGGKISQVCIEVKFFGVFSK